jgi:hypothetical protein
MTAAAIVGLVAGLGAFTVLLAIYGGFCLWVLWGWFMVPLGLPPIGIAWAIGLSTIFAMVAPTPAPAPEGKAKNHLVAIIAKPALALVSGFVVKQFM